MSTLYVEGSASIRQALGYLTEPSHNPDKVPTRNLMLESNCTNPTEFLIESKRRINRATGVQNEVYSVRLSFSREEFDPNNKNDQQLALDVSRSFTEAWLKEKEIQRPYVIALQADGQSGLLHSHIYICNPGTDGKGIPKGVSALKMQDLNDHVMRQFMLSHNRSTRVQDELIRNKREHDGNSILTADSTHLYGRSKSNAKAAKNRQTMTQSLKWALHEASSRQEFLQLIRQQGIYLNRRANGSDDIWLKKDGTFRKSISIEYKGTKARTVTLLGMNLEQIAKQLEVNRQNQRVKRSETDIDIVKSHKKESTDFKIASSQLKTSTLAKQPEIRQPMVQSVQGFTTLQELIRKKYVKLFELNKQLSNESLTKAQRQRLLIAKSQLIGEISELESALSVAKTKEEEHHLEQRFQGPAFRKQDELEF